MKALGRIIACLGFVFVAMLGSALGASAQATPEAGGEALAVQAETTELAVNTVLCEDTSCDAFTTVDGALISAFDVQTREPIDSCTVVAGATPAGCTITVPADPNLSYIEWDEALIPAGYIQAGDPFTVDGVLTLGFTDAPTPTVEPAPGAHVTAVACDDAACANPQSLPGAVLTSYDGDGEEIASCTVEIFDDYEGCTLVLPDDGGTVDVTPPAGFENYVLLSAEPEIYDSEVHGRIYLWKLVPGDEPAGGIPVNVVACDVVGCTDPVTIDGAELISYQDGVEIDRCVVESEADDFDGCTLFISADKANVDITPAAPYEDYVLVSEEPDVYESAERGRIYVWTFVPADAEPTAVPTAAATAEPVTALPETGTGADATSQGALVIMGIGMVALALAMMSTRLARR